MEAILLTNYKQSWMFSQ